MARKNRVVIPCRFAYFHCWEPTKVYGTEHYTLVALISKNDTETIEKIDKAVAYVKEKAMIEKWGGRLPAHLGLPMHDGDEEKPNNPIFKDCYYINAKSRNPPQIVDANVDPIQDRSEVYAGCYGNVSINFYGYNCGGNRGIGAGLGNIQKVKDGPSLNGVLSAADEFLPIREE